jgi:hypothetical protein
MKNILDMQKSEANKEFFKFISKHYLKWLKEPGKESTPTLSHTLFKDKVMPAVSPGVPTFFILVDNLRYDHFKMMRNTHQRRFQKSK